jgi:hypothetical protein
MKRSAGIVVTAVIVLLGSGFTLFCGACVILALSMGPTQKDPLHLMKYFMFFCVAILLGTGGWGVATGVGLLSLKGWARVSLLVFSGVLLVFCLPMALVFSVVPMQQTPNANLPENFHTVFRAGMVGFYGLLAAVGGWWLYYFNRRAVKAQFEAGVALPAGAAAARKRPISVAVIAWYLIVTACFLPMIFFIRVPTILVSFVFTGLAATLIIMAYGVLHIVMGIGLLKLKEWSRILAICYFVFLICNTLASVLLPGSQARYEQMMSAMRVSMGLPSQTGTVPPAWLGLLFGLPVACAVLWFLITEKKAFQGSTEAPAPVS